MPKTKTTKKNEGGEELCAALEEQLAVLGSMRHAAGYLAQQFTLEMTGTEKFSNIMARALLLSMHDAVIEEWQQFLDEMATNAELLKKGAELGKRNREAIRTEGGEGSDVSH